MARFISEFVHTYRIDYFRKSCTTNCSLNLQFIFVNKGNQFILHRSNIPTFNTNINNDIVSSIFHVSD